MNFIEAMKALYDGKKVKHQSMDGYLYCDGDYIKIKLPGCYPEKVDTFDKEAVHAMDWVVFSEEKPLRFRDLEDWTRFRHKNTAQLLIKVPLHGIHTTNALSFNNEFDNWHIYGDVLVEV